ncbi:LIPID TRANSFER PROTEIN [Salix koriyanagi]|uniref:LIPID TRANSFER PROTEIN n=1 Tax=Salix koriyanagi TaxID=2511006 RepID=A0A9Q1A549_9ROSI|nr:LIPID TRANSFER PROTEIN [Salix koriyanagi]
MRAPSVKHRLFEFLYDYMQMGMPAVLASLKPKPTPPASCPRDTLKLGACADILGLVNVAVGTPPYTKCCPLLGGLADLDVALCLCTAIKANVLGINLNIPVALSVLVSACGKSIPPDFKCQ